MTDDLISRYAALNALCDNCDHVKAVCAHYPCKQYLSIEKLPSAQPEQRWIPVTERLPIVENAIGKRVLATTTWGLTVEAMFCKDHWEIHDIDYKLTSVAAWMPLPEPYAR